jgi:hypothetical protein
VMADMFQGAEAYLQTWERADGVPAASCRPAHERFTAAGLGPARRLRLGESTVAALFGAGQPASRPGRTYHYCITGSRRSLTAVFNSRGRVAIIAGAAKGDRAGGIRPGDPVRSLARRGHRIGRHGLWVGRRLRGGARFLYAVRAGRVRFVAVAGARELRSPRRLSADVRAAHL